MGRVGLFCRGPAGVSSGSDRSLGATGWVSERGGGYVGLSFEKSHPGLFIEKGVLRDSMVVARGDDNGAGVEEAVRCRVEASLLSASVSEPRALA